MKKLNRLLEEKGIQNVIVVGCHPGLSYTDIGRSARYWWYRKLEEMTNQSAEMGAMATVLATTDPQAVRNGYAGLTGFESIGDH